METLLNRITVDVNVCKGKPSIRSMRFTVAQMLEMLSSGMTFEEILADYPYLENDDIAACLHYASAVFNTRKMLLTQGLK